KTLKAVNFNKLNPSTGMIVIAPPSILRILHFPLSFSRKSSQTKTDQLEYSILSLMIYLLMLTASTKSTKNGGEWKSFINLSSKMPALQNRRLKLFAHNAIIYLQQ